MNDTTITAASDSDRPVESAPAPVLVPLAEAGAGMPDTALGVAHRAGWDRYDDELGDVTYVSPDRALQVEFGPENSAAARTASPITPLWRVTWTNPDPYHRRDRSWTAHFSDDVPAEAIAAFLTALIDTTAVEIDRWD